MQLPEFLVLHMRDAAVMCPQCQQTITAAQIRGYGVRDVAGKSRVMVFVMATCVCCRLTFGHDIRVMPKPVFSAWIQRLYSPENPTSTPRPSVRPGTPTKPISKDEARQMISQIERVSFKRRTKSWQQFMKRLSTKPGRRRHRRRED